MEAAAEGNGRETIDALLQNPGFAAYQGAAYSDIVDVVLDGNKLRRSGLRIGDLPLDFGLTEDERNGPGEIVSVANVLARLGYSRVVLTKGERPDFTVDTPDGRIGIEHTRAYTGYQIGSEEHLHQGIQTLRADPAFRALIGNLTISMVVDRSPIYRTPEQALNDPEPQGFMGNRDVSSMLAEIRMLAGEGYFHGIAGAGRQTIAGPNVPALVKFRAAVDVDQALSDETAGVHVAVSMWKPGRLSLFDACIVNIADKTKKAAKYPAMPDWLVIQAVAPPDVFVYDLADHEMTSLGPFRKVFVLSPHIDGRSYLASYTIAADGTIEADIPDLPAVEEPYDAGLHEWAAGVERVLQPRRIRTYLDAGDRDDVPKMTSDPMQVQWYRKWLGPNPWVSCMSNGDCIRMRFWIAPDWNGGETLDIESKDVEQAANRIWEFILPNAGAVHLQ